MRRGDSVFFFTLVDFLLTSLFFGLVVFVIAASNSDQKALKAKAAAADSIRKAAGVSDLTVLTDYLTRLGPLRTAQEASQLVRDAGGVAAAKKAIAVVSEAGGSDTVAARLARLQQREGAGKPHCLLDQKHGGKNALAIARVVGTDATLSFVNETPELDQVMAMIGVTFAQVHEMPLAKFRHTFVKLIQVQPKCRYTIEFYEHTRYVDARDAVRGLFYMRIHH